MRDSESLLKNIIKYLILFLILVSPAYAQDVYAPEVTRVETRAECNQYIELVEKYDWDVDMVMRIMEAESSCVSYAVGDGHLTFEKGTKGMSCGLMQIRVLDGRPDCETLKDPITNIEWAYKIYQERGNFTPWSVYKNLQ